MDIAKKALITQGLVHASRWEVGLLYFTSTRHHFELIIIINCNLYIYTGICDIPIFQYIFIILKIQVI
jgi:hypothetical protein